jgi:hypothetical protein
MGQGTCEDCGGYGEHFSNCKRLKGAGSQSAVDGLVIFLWILLTWIFFNLPNGEIHWFVGIVSALIFWVVHGIVTAFIIWRIQERLKI